MYISEQQTSTVTQSNHSGFTRIHRTGISMLLVLVLASLSCVGQGLVQLVTPTPIYTQALEVYTSPPHTYTPAETETLVPRVYTVAAYHLYVRDADLQIVDVLDQGTNLVCVPSSSGWCLLENGTRVWQGCLSDPGPYECEER